MRGYSSMKVSPSLPLSLCHTCTQACTQAHAHTHTHMHTHTLEATWNNCVTGRVMVWQSRQSLLHSHCVSSLQVQGKRTLRSFNQCIALKCYCSCAVFDEFSETVQVNNTLPEKRPSTILYLKVYQPVWDEHSKDGKDFLQLLDVVHKGVVEDAAVAMLCVVQEANPRLQRICLVHLPANNNINESVSVRVYISSTKQWHSRSDTHTHMNLIPLYQCECEGIHLIYETVTLMQWQTHSDTHVVTHTHTYA